MKTLWYLAFFLCLNGALFASSYTINKGCFNLQDINRQFIDKDISCNINYAEERKISLNLIKSYLPKAYHSMLPDTNFIVVKREGVEITEDDLRKDILTLLAKDYPDTRFEVVKLIRGVKITAAKKDTVSIKLPEHPIGTSYLIVNNGIKDYNVYAYIKGYKKMYVSTDMIKKGDVINDKIIQKEVEITNLKETPYENNYNAIAIQNIPKNRVITLKMVKGMPEKTKGEGVKIVYKNGDIALETEGVMMEDAYSGALVQVKNPSSEKILTGVYKDGSVFVK